MGGLSLRQLEFFVVLAEEVHYVRAAKRLGIAQPPLSRAIRRLERAVGVTLLDRTSRSVALTAAGRAMLAPARRPLAEAGRAADAAVRAADGESGELTVGFSASASFSVLPALIGRYRRRHPSVRLTLVEQTTSAQLADLESSLIDVAVARGPIISPALHGTVVCREPFQAVLPSDHALALRDAVPLSALAGERFVLFPRHVAPTFYDVLMAAFRAAGFSPTVGEEAAEWHTIVGLVGAGLGVASLLNPSSGSAGTRWPSEA